MSVIDRLSSSVHRANRGGHICGHHSWLGQSSQGSARLRQAWEACFQAEDAATLQKKRGSESTDLDKLLDSTTLQTQREVFYARYKVKYPAWIEPSDVLVSRIYKELSKRLLQVYSAWKTKSLGYQMKAERKRQNSPTRSILSLRNRWLTMMRILGDLCQNT